MTLVVPRVIRRAIGGVNRAVRDWVQKRRRLRRVRTAPNFDRYLEDLETAGAFYVDHGTTELGPFVVVEFDGNWADLRGRVELEYRLIAESNGSETTEIRLRPGLG